jgi:hypothetical protein
LVLASTSSLGCRQPFVTERYVNSAYGGFEGCIQARAPGSVARSLEFKRLRIDGDHATAVVVPTGGPYDGERITVSLVHDRWWAVDGLRADVPVGP